MSVQALRLMQALREIVAKKAEIDSFPAKVRVELERNNDINATILINGVFYAVVDMAIIILNGIEVETCTCGTASGASVSLKPEAAAA